MSLLTSQPSGIGDDPRFDDVREDFELLKRDAEQGRVCPPSKTSVQSAYKAVLNLGLSKAEIRELAAMLTVESHDEGDVIVRAAGRTS